MKRAGKPASMRAAALLGHDYAHRGLHGDGGPVENSLAAFAAARDRGFGVECDVGLSADGVPFVFHDETLDRLTGERGAIADRRAVELDSVLLTGDGPIPRLSALLALVAGRVPLLIELKVARGEQVLPLCAAVRDALTDYLGITAVMSFHPSVSAWFRAHDPSRIRGLAITEENAKGNCGAIRRHLAMRIARPDFLAYDIRDLPGAFAGRAREGGVPILSWTVQSARHWKVVRDHADGAIFEGEPEQGHGR